jgi:hypothetical protein
MQIACTTVRVEGATPSVESHFGIVRLDIHGMVLMPFAVQTTGLGITIGAKSTNIGWLDEQFVSAPNASACQIFIFPKKREDVDALRSALANASTQLTNVCIFGGKADENK